MIFYLILMIILFFLCNSIAYMYKYAAVICVYLLIEVSDLRMASSQDM